MKSDKGDWRIESDPVLQMVFAFGCALIGMGLLFWSGHAALGGEDGASSGSRHAVMALGALMTLIGGWLGLTGGKTVVDVQPRRRLLVIEQKGRWSTRQRVVPFADIVSFELGQAGDSEGGSVSYHVVMTLRRGPPVRLFVGFFPGRTERAVMQARCDRLMALVKDIENP